MSGEKQDAMVQVACTAADKRRWQQAFGRRELSRTVRALLDRAASKAEGRANRGPSGFQCSAQKLRVGSSTSH